MKKKSTVLIVMLLIFTLLGTTSSLRGSKIENPVFVKSLIYSEDMDIDLNYIAPKGFDKSVDKIWIPNAPTGIDCVVYGEEKESEGKYSVGTVNMGVNCDYWSEETGIGNDLVINELIITWSDGSLTSEDIGRITVTGRNVPLNDHMSITGHDGIRKATYTLTNDTEITGLDFPYTDEVLDIICNITINDVPLEDISKESPIILKKNEICMVEYQVNDESKSQYGNVSIRGFLMGKSGKKEDKIASFTFVKRYGLDEGARKYLEKSVDGK